MSVDLSLVTMLAGVGNPPYLNLTKTLTYSLNQTLSVIRSSGTAIVNRVAVDCAPTQSPFLWKVGKVPKRRRSRSLTQEDHTFQGDEPMLKSKKKLSALLMAAMTLMLAGAAGFAQRHFMLANAARPEVNVQLSGVVERDSKLMPLEKSSV